MKGKSMKKAFTLIELLVVVLIIGILSAIALPQYQKAVVKTRYAKQKALVRAIANAEEVYYLANSEYTLDVDSLDVSLPPITSSGTSTDRKYLYFSWGYCAIYVGAQNRDLFECTDNLAKISYAIVFNHSGQWAGKQRCTVEQTYVIGNEICKADSGLTNPTDTQDPVYYYVW